MSSQNRHVARVTLPVCATILATVAWWASAGDLNPPPGPIAPTMKTLAQVEARTPLSQSQVPITISQPGSYYLTGNLFAPALIPAIITISSPGVTLDLNGFQLDAVTEVGQATNGIRINVAATNCTVRNGSIIEAIGDGVQCSASDCTFVDLHISECLGSGLVTADSANFERCTATNNVLIGFTHGVNESAVVRSCIASGNGSHGFDLSGAIEACMATSNGANGFSGTGSFFGCISSQNDSHGFSVSNSAITKCQAFLNLGDGIHAFNSTLVAHCESAQNVGSGIDLLSRCTALGNNCSGNGFFPGNDGAGIRAALHNRIEANNCTSNDLGIDVDQDANVIIKNTCSTNVINWTIAANNVFGPIVDRTAPASAAVSGNSAPDSSGSTHPNANFTY